MATKVLPHSDYSDFLKLGLGAAVWLLAYQSLHPFADFISYTLLGLERGTHAGDAVNFFWYDVPKILLLLSGMIFIITLLRTFVTPAQTRRLLGGKREGVGNLLASLLGVVTPFCSCSAVPLFIGFIEAGIPLGVTFSFLVTAPMVNEVALIMLFGMFGFKVTALYLFSGITLGIVSGIVIGRLKLEHYVEEFVYQVKIKNAGQTLESPLTWHERMEQATTSTREIVSKTWLYIVVGIAIGAIIHGYIPADYLAEVMGRDAWYTVPLVVLLAVPMYSNAAGIVPIVSVLIDKGVALGTALAFMMGVVGLSLPEMIILRRVLKPRLIAIYVGILSTGIILTGYLFNLVL